MAVVYEHSHLVTVLLADENQEILLNSSNLNILDIAVERNSAPVVETIVEDPRYACARNSPSRSENTEQGIGIYDRKLVIPSIS